MDERSKGSTHNSLRSAIVEVMFVECRCVHISVVTGDGWVYGAQIRAESSQVYPDIYPSGQRGFVSP